MKKRKQSKPNTNTDKVYLTSVTYKLA